MPRYDYRCRQCEQTFEVQQPIDAAHSPDLTCPSGHDQVTRVWSAVALAGRGGPAAPAASGACCGGGCCG